MDTGEVASGTLRDLVENLGPHALRLVTGTEVQLCLPVGEPVVYGPDEPIHDVAGNVVLLTGGRSDPAEVLDRIRQAAAARACAVVVKAWGKDLGRVAAAARDAGIALLCTPDEMAWRRLDAFVAAASAVRATIVEEAGDAGDLFGLANAIAAALGGPVTIEEVDGRVLAYSNLPNQEIDEIRRLAILGRRTPERPSNAAQYQAIVTAQGPVRFASSHPEYADRLAVAVRAGHQVLGVIFVLADRPKLVEDADRALVDAARSVALHLLRSRDSVSPERERRGEALRGLLTATLDAASAAAALSLPVRTSFVLAIARPAPTSEPRSADAARVADLIALHGEYWHPESAAVLSGGDVVLLLPVLDPPADPRGEARLAARLRRLGTDMVTAARRSARVELLVGFGTVVDGLANVPRNQRLVGRVVDTLQDPHADAPHGGVATLHDVRSQVVLACLRSGTPIDDELRLPAVRAVLDHDAGQGTDYARTLLTYLGAAGDFAATADVLGVHENTARYRIRRLTEKFGIALDAGDETLVTWLQLRNAGG